MLKLQVLGNLTDAPRRQSYNGEIFWTARVIHNFVNTNKSTGELTEVCTAVSCVFDERFGNRLQCLGKGDKIYVEGRPDVRTYQTTDGRTAAGLNLRVLDMDFASSRNRDNNSMANYQQSEQVETF